MTVVNKICVICLTPFEVLLGSQAIIGTIYKCPSCKTEYVIKIGLKPKGSVN